MAKEAKKTVIGIFILGAVFLGIVAVLVLGSGEFLKKRPKYVMFFDESVKGLSVGAPVVFRGVQVGRVTQVLLRADLNNMDLSIPVIVEFDVGKVRLIEDGSESDRNIQRLVDSGLKAQLQTQSFLTGQLLIDLDLRPDSPAKFVGGFDDIPEIPTIPTMLEEISRTLQGLKVRESIERLMEVIEGLDSFINSPDLKNTVITLNRTAGNAEKLVGSAEKLVSNLERQIDPLSNSLKETLDGYEKLAHNIDRHIDPLADNLGNTINEITVAAEEAEKTLAEFKGLVAEDSITATELRKTLKELSSAARSIRIWADYLESHPEALVWGKGK
ncbi:MlaD family protein [Thermodesulfobacteriota bacterium]